MTLNLKTDKVMPKKKHIKLPNLEERIFISIDDKFQSHNEVRETWDGDDNDVTTYEYSDVKNVADVVYDSITNDKYKIKKTKTKVNLYSTRPKEKLQELKDIIIGQILDWTIKHRIAEGSKQSYWYFIMNKDAKYPYVVIFDEDDFDEDSMDWDGFNSDYTKPSMKLKKELDNLGIRTKNDLKTGTFLFYKEEDMNLARLVVEKLQKPYWLILETLPIEKLVKRKRKILEDSISVENYYEVKGRR
jgi:predicted RNA binding protein with dsRBD fold (UPF0201 family)